MIATSSHLFLSTITNGLRSRKENRTLQQNFVHNKYDFANLLSKLDKRIKHIVFFFVYSVD